MVEANVSFEIVNRSDDESLRLVMQWRNDVDTRKQSFDQEPKEWPKFRTEFLREYSNDPSLPCFFALVAGRRVAFIRFRRLKDLNGSSAQQALPYPSVDVSINVAPEERARGLGKLILSRIGELLLALGICSALAEIKVGNDTSERVFKAAGFEFLDCVDRITKSGEICRVNRLVYRAVPSLGLGGVRNLQIGNGHPCFIIAEAGSNWRMGNYTRDLKMAKTLILIAKDAGADAVKFQTYRPETTYVTNAGESDYLADSGIKESISEIFADLSMPYEMLSELSAFCDDNDIVFMSSPFSVADLNAVDQWVSIHKIASYEICHIRLLEAAAATRKPLILSTGASTTDDITWAVSHFKSLSDAPICLMQCTAKYPAPNKALNLRAIPTLKAMYGVPVGLSDHSRNPIVGPVSAVAVGANLLEKHFTVDNRLPGPDHAFALEPDELKLMISSIRQAEEAMGHGVKDVLPDEQELFLYAKRGLQAIRDIQVGDHFVEDENFAILRPGKQTKGASPTLIDQLRTSTANRSIKTGEGIQLCDCKRE